MVSEGMAQPDTPQIKEPPSDEAVVAKLKELLQAISLDATERQIRQQLEAHFGVELKSRRDVIRKEVMAFIEAKQEADEIKGEAEEDGDEQEQPRKRAKRSGAGLGSKLSPALQAFLGVETMARTAVVKELWAYIKAHELQDPSNRRKILVDEKLGTILTPPVDIFTMNKQLSKHVFTNDRPGNVESEEDESGAPKGKQEKKKKPRKRAAANGEEGEKKATKGGGGGFVKPLKVTPELSEFLGGQAEISRGELTKFFWAYVKENDCLNPENRREVICNEALEKLTGEKRFLAFGFQKHFSKHFVKG